MGQYWQIVNLDTLESPLPMGKLGENLWDSQGDLVRRLCAPVKFPKTPRARAKVTEPGARNGLGHNTVTFDTILAIPELIIAIFESVSTYFDCLSFGLTNSEVWACGERIIQQHYVQFCAPWRGSRLICVGDYARDVPAQLNNAQELAKLAATFQRLANRDANDEPPNYFHQQILKLSHNDTRTCGPATTASVASQLNVSFEELETDEARDEWQIHLEDLALSLYGFEVDSPDDPDLFSTYDRLSRKQQKAQSRDMDYVYAWTMDRGRRSVSGKGHPVMVLRNLTKRLFVRSDTFSVTGVDPLWGFGRAIVSRICWSTDPSVSMSWRGNIHRGVWAGDAFDIIPLSTFAQSGAAGMGEPDGWTDVTMEVREELIAIWKSEFGNEWEHHAW